MCKVTITDQWRNFFRSIEYGDLKIFRGNVLGVDDDGKGVNHDCVLLRREELEDIVRRAGMTIRWGGVDRCMVKTNYVEEVSRGAPITFQSALRQAVLRNLQ